MLPWKKYNNITLTMLLMAAVFSFANIPVNAAATPKGEKVIPAAKAKKMTSAPKATKVQTNWAINCASPNGTSPLVCNMSQTLLVKGTRKRILLVTINNSDKKSGNPTMILALPHGLYLPAGVTLKFDNKQSKKVEIRTADQNGSYARISLDPATVNALKLGSKLIVSLTSLKQQKINFPVSLIGFSASLKRISSLE